MDTQELIIADIIKERQRQDAMWHGTNHDNQHDERDWISFIVHQLGHIEDAKNDNDIVHRFIKIAALAIAALESGAYRGQPWSA